MSEAWVTLATNDTYAIGAMVLAESLKRVGTTRPCHILVTTAVTAPVREQLAAFFQGVTVVDVLDSRDEANLALIQRPDLGVTFTKLSCWTLTQYTKAVFLDADCLVIKNSDELFEYPELSAAPDIGWPDIFNSGVFVFVPSIETYHSLIRHATTNGSFDGGDQGLLNAYFSDWITKGPSHRLPFVYNMSSNVFYTYVAAYKQFGKNVKIVHFLGAVKPWNHYFDVQTHRFSYRADSFSHSEYVEHWWRLFVESVLPGMNAEVPTSPEAPEPLSAVAEDGVRIQEPEDPKQLHRLTFALPAWMKELGKDVSALPPPHLGLARGAFSDEGLLSGQSRTMSLRAAIDNLLTARPGSQAEVRPIEALEAAQRFGVEQAIGGKEHLAAWERGNIEYLGRDAWENIQKRLDESLK